MNTMKWSDLIKLKKQNAKSDTARSCLGIFSIQTVLVRENRLKLNARQLLTRNKGETFNVKKMQLQPEGKPSLSVARGVRSEKYPHPHDGCYHLH